MKNLSRNLATGLLIILLTMGLCTTKTHAQCHPSFTWTQTANNVISFTNTTTGAYPTSGHSWTFPNYFADDTAANPIDTFEIPGAYEVCLNYFDSFNDCNATYCDSIHVT